MTACALLFLLVDRRVPDGPQIPLLLADTLVSYDGGYGSRAVLPSVTSPDIAQSPSRVALARKLVIFGDAAVAMAGDGRLITGVVHELRIGLPEGERPSRWLANLTNHINQPGRRQGLSALCAFPVDSGHSRGMQCTLPKDRKLQFVDGVGYWTSIGSGGEELFQTVMQIVRSLPADYTCWQILSMISGPRLAMEIIGEARNSWGGYVEHASWQDGRWDRGGRVLHIFMLYTPCKDGFTTTMLSRVVAYDPRGRLYSVSNHKTGPHFQEFILEEIAPINDVVSISEEEFWRNWSPDIINITFIGNVPDGRLCLPSHVIDPTATNGLEISIHPNGWRVQMTDELKNSISTSVLQTMGIEYIPSTTDPNIFVDVGVDGRESLFLRERY